VRKVERKYGKARHIGVFDRGVVSEAFANEAGSIWWARRVVR